MYLMSCKSLERCQPEVSKSLSNLNSAFYLIGTDRQRVQSIEDALRGLPDHFKDDEIDVVKQVMTESICSSIALVSDGDVFQRALALLISVPSIGECVLRGAVHVNLSFDCGAIDGYTDSSQSELLTPFLYLCANAHLPCVAQNLDKKLYAFLDINPIFATTVSYPNAYAPEELLLESAKVAEDAQFETILSSFHNVKDCFRCCVTDISDEFEWLVAERADSIDKNLISDKFV